MDPEPSPEYDSGEEAETWPDPDTDKDSESDEDETSGGEEDPREKVDIPPPDVTCQSSEDEGSEPSLGAWGPGEGYTSATPIRCSPEEADDGPIWGESDTEESDDD